MCRCIFSRRIRHFFLICRKWNAQSNKHIFVFRVNIYLCGKESEDNSIRFRTVTRLHRYQTGNNVISNVRRPPDRRSEKNT
jgi:hypothetical protein